MDNMTSDELTKALEQVLKATDRETQLKVLRACAKITSHFRIPSSAHLCLHLNRKILEIPPILAGLSLWICSIGAAKSDQNLGANSVK